MYSVVMTVTKTILQVENFPAKKGDLTVPAKAIWYDCRFTAKFMC